MLPYLQIWYFVQPEVFGINFDFKNIARNYLSWLMSFLLSLLNVGLRHRLSPTIAQVLPPNMKPQIIFPV